MADGDEPSHRGRSARRSARSAGARDRSLPAYARRPSQRGRDRRGPRRHDAARAGALRGRRQRQPRTAASSAALPVAARVRADRRAIPRALGAGRIDRLEHDDGLGPVGQLEQRGRADAPRGAVDEAPDRRADAALSGQPGSRRRRAAGCPARRRGLPRDVSRHADRCGGWGRPLAVAGRDVMGRARAPRPLRRHRLEQLGGVRRAHVVRQAAARERSSPGADDAVDLVPRPPVGAGPRRDRRDAARAPVRRDRAQRPHRVGADEHRSRHAGPVHRATAHDRRRRRGAHTRRLAAAADDPRDDPREGRCRCRAGRPALAPWTAGLGRLEVGDRRDQAARRRDVRTRVPMDGAASRRLDGAGGSGAEQGRRTGRASSTR